MPSKVCQCGSASTGNPGLPDALGERDHTAQPNPYPVCSVEFQIEQIGARIQWTGTSGKRERSVPQIL